MSPCISLRQTDAHTQRARHPHKTKWLLLFCHFVYVVHIIAISLFYISYASWLLLFKCLHFLTNSPQLTLLLHCHLPLPAVDLNLSHCGQTSLWNFPQDQTTSFCFYNVGNGLVSEALIFSQHYGKEMAVRWRLKALRSIHFLITTPDAPPQSDWFQYPDMGSNCLRVTRLIEHYLLINERYQQLFCFNEGVDSLSQ